MSLANLSNENLLSCFDNCVRSERKITAQVLECIAEIDRRRLYVEKNFTSLFDFLVKDFGYSPGAAMRRIDAARLLRELPETAMKFENGALTLSQANQLQRAAREFKKAKCETLSTINKRELVLQIENSTQKKTEQILAATLDLPVLPVQKEKLHRDQSVTLTVTFTQEQMQILETAQNLISHCVARKNWAEIFTHLAKKEVARRTAVRKGVSQQEGKSHKKQISRKLNQISQLDQIDQLGQRYQLNQSDQISQLDEPNQTNQIDRVNRVALRNQTDLPISKSATAVTTVKSEKTSSVNQKTAKTLSYTRPHRPVIPAKFRKTLLHADARCEYKDDAGKSCASQRFLQIDHIHSWYQGGTHDPQNLQVLCGTHNRLKFGREMACEGGIPLP